MGIHDDDRFDPINNKKQPINNVHAFRPTTANFSIFFVNL